MCLRGHDEIYRVALNSSVNKVLIVCPVTLVTNWKKEFKKWWVPLLETVSVH